MDHTAILPLTWGIPKEFRDRLGDRPGKQRAMFVDGHLLLILHKVPEVEEKERRGRFFWRKPDGTWTSTDCGSGPDSLAKHLREYSAAIEHWDLEEDRAKRAEDFFAILAATAPLTRAVGHLHQTLEEARKLVPSDRGLINCRDQSYELHRLVDLLAARAKNGLDVLVAKRAEEESRASLRMAVSAHRLNILAALFFPLATLSAIFGVSFSDQKGWEPQLGMLVGGGILVGFVLAMVIARPLRKSQDTA